MPIFEYRCRECGRVFEELVTGDRNKTLPCPSCNSRETEKLMSAIGAISMGKSADSSCGSACSHSHSCGASGGGCCPHAG